MPQYYINNLPVIHTNLKKAIQLYNDQYGQMLGVHIATPEEVLQILQEEALTAQAQGQAIQPTTYTWAQHTGPQVQIQNYTWDPAEPTGQPNFHIDNLDDTEPTPAHNSVYKNLFNEKKSMKDIIISKCYKYKSLSKYIGLEGKTKIRAGTTYIGLEIELEKVKITSIPNGTWKMTEDGSLKEEGKEFITIPIQFKYLEVELDRLFKGLKSSSASTRCSVHVHINARDLNLEELKNFILLYLIFEKSLYNFSGNRINNNFCVPLFYYPSIVRDFLHYLTNNKMIYEHWYKYFGFNLSPIFGGESDPIGTIEFRHMKGNTDTKWIISWINLIVSLKLAAKTMKAEDIEKYIFSMNTTSGYYWLAEEIFGPNVKHLTKQETFKEDVESCITLAKSVLTSNKVKTEEIIEITKKR